MANNLGPIAFTQHGDEIDFTPTAAANAGNAQFLNDLFTVNAVDLVANRKAALQVRGGYQITKDTSTFFAGQRVYFDLVNLVATSDPTKGPLIGRAILAQLTGDTSVFVLVNPVTVADTYYVRTAAGAAVSGTAAETVLDSCNFPANRLQVGDVIRFRAQGLQTAQNSTDTLTIRGELVATAPGTTNITLFSTGAIQGAVNDIYVIEGDITVRALGNDGVGLIVAGGNLSFGAPLATQKTWSTAATNMNTTVNELFKLTAQFSSASAGNSVRADHCCVELLRQQ